MYDTETLDRCLQWIYKYGFSFAFVIFVAWPCLTLPVGVFPVEYFSYWIAIAIVWGLVASVIVIGLPLWESRHSFYLVAKGIFADIFLGGFTPPILTETSMKEKEGETLVGINAYDGIDKGVIRTLSAVTIVSPDVSAHPNHV